MTDRNLLFSGAAAEVGVLSEGFEGGEDLFGRKVERKGSALDVWY